MSDLVQISIDEVVEIAKRWSRALLTYRVSGNELHLINVAEDELLAAVTLLEEREKVTAQIKAGK